MENVVSNWKIALTQAASLSGWDVPSCRSEGELMQQIVEDVLAKLDSTFLSITEFPVGLESHIGITVLVERSLVKIEKNNKLGMHDLIRDMGREIVRENSPKDLGKRSRLWFREDVHDVLTKDTGTEIVEGLVLKYQTSVEGNQVVE
ncbi:hypothetical protein P8452_73561 [Trifolium repens]|nr:hypothetical protein P8452_73561 [Trifolium repens]